MWIRCVCVYMHIFKRREQQDNQYVKWKLSTHIHPSMLFHDTRPLLTRNTRGQQTSNLINVGRTAVRVSRLLPSRSSLESLSRIIQGASAPFVSPSRPDGESGILLNVGPSLGWSDQGWSDVEEERTGPTSVGPSGDAQLAKSLEARLSRPTLTV